MTDPEDSSMTMVGLFGVGCIWFELTSRATPQTWAERLVEELNKLPSIEELHVNVSFFDGIDIDDAGQQPDMGTVHFKLNVPRRFQEEQLGHLTENSSFFFYLTYRFYGPAAFVVPATIDGSVEGSEAFKIVRSFLRRELSERSSVQLRIDGTPPYSFHGDFATLRSRVDAEPRSPSLQVSRRPQYGYDSITVTLSTQWPDDAPDVVLSRVFEHLADEFSFFYSLSRERAARLVTGVDIINEAQQLAETYQRTGVRAYLRRLFRSGTAARNLTLRQITAVADEAMMARANAKSLDELRHSQSGIHFERELREYMEESYRFELDAAGSIVETLEGSRRKELEIAIVSASTLLGAAAGAVASIIVR